MDYPEFPEGEFKPSLRQVIIELLESIAKEERALARILNAEAKKIQTFLGTNGDFPTQPSNQEIIQFNHGVNRIMDSVIMKEWLLLKKLETVLQIRNKAHTQQYPGDENEKHNKHHSKHKIPNPNLGYNNTKVNQNKPKQQDLPDWYNED